MNQFHKLFRWVWSILVVFTLAFTMGGCEGDDGAPGPQGPQGDTGQQGPAGPGLDPVVAAVEAANVESCGICHDGVGDLHQAYYNEYVDSDLTMTITDVTSVENLVDGGFDLTVDFSLALNGAPFIGDPATFPKKSFYVVQLLANGDFVNSGGFFPTLSGSLVVSNNDGTYTLAQNVAYDVAAFDGGAIVGSIGLVQLDFPDNPYTAGAAASGAMKTSQRPRSKSAAAPWPHGSRLPMSTAARLATVCRIASMATSKPS